MSRTARPHCRCSLGPRFALALALVGDSGKPVLVEKAAKQIDCRPAQLRRCLEGRPVSAKARGRIMMAAGVAA